MNSDINHMTLCPKKQEKISSGGSYCKMGKTVICYVKSEESQVFYCLLCDFVICAGGILFSTVSTAIYCIFR